MNIVILPNGYFPDPSLPKPVANGSIYIGIADLDPEIPANQKSISVLQEDGSEISVSQPVSTSNGGVPVYNGSPVSVIVPDIPYSIKVLDADGAQVYYIPSVSGVTSGDLENAYYPNSEATDHGITGDSDTIKYYLEQIGTTNKATVFLSHDSGNQYTDYDFLTTFNASAYSNVLFVLENGARFNIGAGVTFTLDSIYNFQVIHTQTIKTGSGTLTTTEGNITTSIYGLLGAELTQSNLVDSSDTGGILTQNDLLDEDDMVSDSDTLPATQQSIKAYNDNTRPVFVDNTSGYPIVGSGAGNWVDLSAYAINTWHDFGPTGSGATTIWTGGTGSDAFLDNLSLTAKYLWLKINVDASESAGVVTNGEYFDIHAIIGEVAGVADQNTIVYEDSRIPNSSNIARFACVAIFPVPLSSKNTFQIYFDSSYETINYIYLYAIGYGF